MLRCHPPALPGRRLSLAGAGRRDFHGPAIKYYPKPNTIYDCTAIELYLFVPFAGAAHFHQSKFKKLLLLVKLRIDHTLNGSLGLHRKRKAFTPTLSASRPAISMSFIPSAA